MERLLSLSEAAELLNISRDWLYRRVEGKEIPHIRLGRAIRFKEEEVRQFIQKNSVGVKGEKV